MRKLARIFRMLCEELLRPVDDRTSVFCDELIRHLVLQLALDFLFT